MKIEKFTTYEISGKTYAFKEILKKMGAEWNKKTETWTLTTGGMSLIGGQKYELEKMQKAGIQITEL